MTARIRALIARLVEANVITKEGARYWLAMLGKGR